MTERYELTVGSTRCYLVGTEEQVRMALFYAQNFYEWMLGLEPMRNVPVPYVLTKEQGAKVRRAVRKELKRKKVVA